MDRFSQFNPKTSFLFFVTAAVSILINYNPFFLAASFAAAFAYNFKLLGAKAFKSLICFYFPFTLFVGVFNMIFTSYGVDILFTLNDSNFTLEGLVYGLCQGMMFSAVMLWLSNYSVVMTSDKFMSVFSKAAPNLTLVLTMTLSFLPRLRKNAREISDARLQLGGNEGRLKKSGNNLSALISLTLEESIETANSMKARGFSSKRKPYSKYRFSRCDLLMSVVILLLFAFMIFEDTAQVSEFIFDPKLENASFSVWHMLFFTMLMLIPIIVDTAEDIRWLFLKRKI